MIALVLAACQVPQGALPEPADDIAALELPLTMSCPANADVCTCDAVATNDTVLRVGVTSTGRGEVAQTFTAPRAALVSSIRLGMRRLRADIMTPTVAIVVGVRPLSNGAIPTTPASDIARGSIAYAGLGTATYDISMSPVGTPTPLVPGGVYAIVIYPDPLLVTAGSALLGISGKTVSNPYGSGAAFTRSVTGGGEGGAFTEAASAPNDLSFAVTLASSPLSLALGTPADGATLVPGNTVITGTVTGGTPPYTVTINGAAATVTGGAFSGTETLTEQLNAVTAVVTDAVGGTASQTRGFIVDGTDPVVTFAGFESGQVTNAAAIIPSFLATDANLDVAVATLDDSPFVPGTQVTAEGTHALVVTALDLAGNDVVVTGTFTIDRTPPTILITGVSNGAVTNAAEVLPRFSASDSYLASWSATLNGQPFTNTDSATAEGSYTLVVIAGDEAGNAAETTVSFEIDRTEPGIAITGVTDGTFTNAATVAVGYTIAGALPGSIVAELDGASFTSPAQVTAEGPHTLHIAASDAAGNAAVRNWTFTIDRTGPVVSTSGVAAGASLSVASVTPTFGAADTNLAGVSALLNGTPFDSGTTITAEGSYSLAVTAVDAAGNEEQSTINFILDRTAPSISITGVAADEITNAVSRTPVITIDDVNLANSTILLDGEPFVPGASVAEEGEHVLAISAEDFAGNEASTSVTFTLDRVAPEVFVFGVADGATYDSESVTPTFEVFDTYLTSSSAELDEAPFITGTPIYDEGEHSLIVTASDAAGNVTTVTTTFSLVPADFQTYVPQAADPILTADCQSTDMFCSGAGSLSLGSYRVGEKTVEEPVQNTGLFAPMMMEFSGGEVGSSATHRGELLHIFKPATPTRLDYVRLYLSSLASYTVPAGATMPHLRVELWGPIVWMPSNPDEPDTRGLSGPLASGSIRTDALPSNGITTIDIEGGDELEAGTDYGLVIWVDSLPAGASGELKIGVGSLTNAALTTPLDTHRRSRRRLGADSPFIPTRWRPGPERLAIAGGPTSFSLAPSTARIRPGEVIAFRGPPGQMLTWSVEGSPTGAGFTNGHFSASVEGRYVIRATAIAGEYSGTAALASVEVTEDVVRQLPSGFPPIPPGQLPSIAGDMSVLFTGDAPVQVGVVKGAITSTRAAALTGIVRDRTGALVSGAFVQVVAHPELGMTRTRDDGRFSLAVNAEERVTVVVTKSGFLPVQRTVYPVRGAWNSVDNIVLTQVSTTTAPPITFPSTGAMRHGTLVTEEIGARRPALYFPPGVTAKVVAADGSLISLGSGTLQTVEFTQGASGVDAMPAEIAPGTEYTYAAAMTFTEAAAVGAKGVVFEKNGEPAIVVSYLRNFVNMPVGKVVPAGFYDQSGGHWVPEADGIVVKYLGKTAGVAQFDLTGDDVADNVSNLPGMTNNELLAFAEAPELQPGTYWRVPLQHFSTFDYNWGSNFPAAPKAHPPTGDCNGGCGEKKGSIIQCEERILGESVPVEGTPFELLHWSDRTDGFIPQIRIPLGSDDPSSTRVKATYRVTYEGTVTTGEVASPSSYAAAKVDLPVQDVLGRAIETSRTAVVEVDTYDSSFYSAPAANAGVSGVSFGLYQSGTVVNNLATRTAVRRTTRYEVPVPRFNAERRLGLGGWQLSDHHFYDIEGGVLWMGDGRKLRLDQVDATIAAVRRPSDDVTGVATDILAPGATPTLFWANDAGEIWTSGQTEALLSGLDGVADLTRDGAGNLYYAHNSTENRLVVSRKPAIGESSLFAGGGAVDVAEMFEGAGSAVYLREGYFSIAGLPGSGGLLIGNDRYLLSAIPTPSGAQLQRVATFPGNIESVTATRTGVVYVAASGDEGGNDFGVWRLEPAGLQTLIARIPRVPIGGAETRDSGEDRILLAEGPNGSIYAADRFAGCVHRVSAGGSVSTVVGTCVFADPGTEFSELKGSARLGRLVAQQIAAGHDGKLIAATPSFIYEVTPPSIRSMNLCSGQTATGACLVVPDPRGGVAYAFDTNGRHLKTIDTVNGLDLLTFAYDSGGRVNQIADRDGQITTINYFGVEIDITSRDGLMTRLMLYNGRVTRIELPLSRTHVDVQTNTGGQVTRFTDQRGERTLIEYDKGRVMSHSDPIDSVQNLTEEVVRRPVPYGDQLHGSSVKYVSQENRETYYGTERTLDGVHRIIVEPGSRVTRIDSVGHSESTVTYPEGTKVTTTFAPDFRFGMLVPYAAETVTETPPKGTGDAAPRRRRQSSTKVCPTPATGDDTLALSALTIESASCAPPTDGGCLMDGNSQAGECSDLDTGARIWQSKWNAATRKWTYNSPEALASPLARGAHVVTLDSLGRVAEVDAPAVAPVAYTYAPSTSSDEGRLVSVTQGSRSTTLEYQTGTGLLRKVKTPDLRETTFTWNNTLRKFSILYPDAKTTEIGVDELMHPLSLTPPESDPHAFGYDDRGLETSYTAPAITGDSTVYTTTRQYDKERRLDLMTLPDLTTVDPYYLPGSGFLDNVAFRREGQAASLQFDWSTSYNPATDPQPGKPRSIAAPGVTTSFAVDGPLPRSTTWQFSATGAMTCAVEDHHLDLETSEDRWERTGLLVQSPSGDRYWVGTELDDDGLIKHLTTSFPEPAVGPLQPAADGEGFDVRRNEAGVFKGVGTVGGDAATVYEYDSTYGALTSISATSSVVGVPTSLRLTFNPDSSPRDALGRVTRMEEAASALNQADIPDNTNVVRPAWTATHDYSYDARGRLWTWTRSGNLPDGVTNAFTWTWAYDGNGNRTSATYSEGAATAGCEATPCTTGQTCHAGACVALRTAGQACSSTLRCASGLRCRQGTCEAAPGAGAATYDEQDRLTAMDGVGTLTYDAAGRLATRSSGSVVTRYAYDGLGNLTSVKEKIGSGSETPLVTYEIDGLGRRVGRHAATSKRWIWDGQLRPIAEFVRTGSAWSIRAVFLYADGVNVPEYMVTANGSYLFVKDQLGSVRELVLVNDGESDSGKIIQQITYDPWGNPTFLVGDPEFQPFGFAGGLYDPVTGLVRFGARDYDPKVGRWTAKDPIRFSGGDENLYQYCGGTPLNCIDATGLIPGDIFPTVHDAVSDFLSWYWPESAKTREEVGGEILRKRDEAGRPYFTYRDQDRWTPVIDPVTHAPGCRPASNRPILPSTVALVHTHPPGTAPTPSGKDDFLGIAYPVYAGGSDGSIWRTTGTGSHAQVGRFYRRKFEWNYQ